MGQDVAERLVEITRAMGLRDEICVQGNAHHAAAFSAFCVKSVELPLNHFSKVVALIRGAGAGPDHGRIADLQRIGNGDELALANIDGEWLIVMKPVGLKGEAEFCEDVGRAVGDRLWPRTQGAVDALSRQIEDSVDDVLMECALLVCAHAPQKARIVETVAHDVPAALHDRIA